MGTKSGKSGGQTGSVQDEKRQNDSGCLHKVGFIGRLCASASAMTFGVHCIMELVLIVVIA